MKIYRPLWNEGALLSPQQFQQQAEWESFRSAGVAALASPFTWGVEKIGFNDSLLASGLIQISQLRLWLEDGTLLDAQSSDLPPPPRELDPDQLTGGGICLSCLMKAAMNGDTFVVRGES
ncbi:type VI secretion system baseplate subunit TssK [Atlantibacter hermannii]|uniref:type VI secretion system baseplate subunit TssK n=1 Tax=Atlantibacter hermannii TaxID=565 RepID=UPI0028AB6B18|nr:type VI secretion system baseplate subunit TssK [Atlantibacter hermannii]